MNKFKFDEKNTFCISLENSNRWNKISKRFEYFDIKVTKWIASTPETLTDNFVNNIENGAKACSQSHINILKYVLEHNLEYVLILEDDACFDKLWLSKINNFYTDINDDKWDAIFLNSSEPINELNKWIIADEQYLTGGYIISNNGARNLLNMFKNCYCSSDWMTSRLQKLNHSYSYFPWLIIQEGDETTIGSNIFADHLKVLRCLKEIDYSLDNYII
jgi:GR25 family glycosyltransferase involved in LPS biosynthesis